MTAHTRGNLVFIILLVFLVAALTLLCFLPKAEATVILDTTKIYSTATRDGHILRDNTDGECSAWTPSLSNTALAAQFGASHDGDVAAKFYRFFASFDLSTVSDTVDSAFAAIRVSALVKHTCTDTGTTPFSVFVGDCATGGIGGVGNCATALAIADSNRVATAWRKSWGTFSQPEIGNWLIMKIHPDSIAVGSGHSFDVCYRVDVTEASLACSTCYVTEVSKSELIVFHTQEATGTPNDPYLVIYAHHHEAETTTDPTYCVFGNARLQRPVNNSTPQRLKIGVPNRGLRKMYATS